MKKIGNSIKSSLIIILVCFGLSVQNLFADIYLPAIWSDNMVIQRTDSVRIHGWSSEYTEHIMIVPGWSRDTVMTQVIKGEWGAWLKLPAENGPYNIVIEGHVRKEIKNILIGELWLCSGQSNMRMIIDSIDIRLAGILNRKKIVSEAEFPEIRYFEVLPIIAKCPQQDVKGTWVICSPETVSKFSAVAYIFGKTLYEQLKNPVGLINASWGGTNAVTWVPQSVLDAHPQFSLLARDIPETILKPVDPGVVYNGMIHPLISERIAGAIWYQGEHNVYYHIEYETLFPELIKSWREKWGYEFPFYYVQIPPCNLYGNFSLNYITEVQRNTLKVAGTGMAVISDVSDTTNMHPRNKEPVGYRLALWALNRNYGMTNIICSGPLYSNMKIEKNTIRILFDYSDGGLVCKGKNLTCFQIAAGDSVFYPAEAKIDRNTVVVKNSKVKNPVSVRFGWGNTAQPNLFNSAGLPASGFRTDRKKIL